MIRSTCRVAALLLVLTLLLFTQRVAASEAFRVYASIKPVHSILASLMDGLETPGLLIGEGQSPFAFRPGSEQLNELTGARLIVWVGPELESGLAEVLPGLDPAVPVLTLLDSPSLKILDSRWDASERDPFFWLDSRNGVILIDELTRALVRVDPGRSHLYKRNRDRLHARMTRLDRELEYGYRGLKKGVALSYYDTQQYFEQAYALKISESLARSPDHEMAAERLLAARKRIADGDYACLLLEASLPMPNLELLTSGMEVETGQLDSLGLSFAAGPDLYFQLMEQNTRAIKQCFMRTEESSHQVVEESPSLPGEIGGRFMLVDQDGQLFTDRDLLGKYQLIFFGYTSCPDVCPTSMVVVSQGLKRIGALAEKIQAYFVSVDPERDTPELLRTYTGYFDAGIMGLTGSPEMIERVARAYKVRYEKVMDDDQDSDFYVMDHSASIFLMSPEGRFVTKFPFGTDSIHLAEKLQEYVR